MGLVEGAAVGSISLKLLKVSTAMEDTAKGGLTQFWQPFTLIIIKFPIEL